MFRSSRTMRRSLGTPLAPRDASAPRPLPAPDRGVEAVAGHEERIGDAILLERAPDVHHIDLIVFDQEDVEHLVGHVCFGHRNLKVAPSPGMDSTQTRPRCDSTIFFTSARPIPAP